MLVHQWRDVFRKCILKTYIISKKSDIEYLRYIKNKYQQPILSDVDNNYDETNCIEYYDCIIISATMYEVFNEQFNNIKWARIIIDEVVSIKLPTNLEFKCNFIWFLTATPTGIKHIKRNYIKSLVSAMTDYTINNIIIKNNNDFVDISMNLPNINQIIIKCLTPKELNIVKEYLNDEIVNMINAGNIQEAIVKLNCNVETSDNILEVITKKIKKELHNKKAELSFEQNKIPDDIKIHDEKIKKIEQQIKNLESKCQGLEDRIKLFKKDNCPICLDEFESPILTNCCNNLFCIKCLTLCSKCPLCRALINISACIVINDNKIKDSKPNKENILCSKVNNLITLLKKKPNSKFLLFSNYDRTFENIIKELSDNDIKYSKLTGSNVVINSIIKRFESGEIKVLMLNALNYGSGLNLQMATDIIIYHELKIELETQVIGRAQRLGRTEPLNVYYLMHENEQVNCKNPTLNLDIFENDTTMLDEYINIKQEDQKMVETKDIINNNHTAKPKKGKNKTKSSRKKNNNQVSENKQLNEYKNDSKINNTYDDFFTEDEINRAIGEIDNMYENKNNILTTITDNVIYPQEASLSRLNPRAPSIIILKPIPQIINIMTDTQKFIDDGKKIINKFNSGSPI